MLSKQGQRLELLEKQQQEIAKKSAAWERRTNLLSRKINLSGNSAIASYRSWKKARLRQMTRRVKFYSWA
jgi:hypothetical protein